MDFNGDQENSHSRGGPTFFGAIFMCNRRTKQECFGRSLFGLPSSQASFVNKIKNGTVLFLFEYEERKLYGVFRANSDGAMNIQPNAFKASGKQFPAQVSFRIQWKCHPVTESEFRDAVKDNYYTEGKFGFGLSEDQVEKLLLLFHTTRIKDTPQPSKSLTTSTEVMRKRGKSGVGTVSVSGNGRRVVTTDRAETEQGRDNGPVRMNSARYHTSPRPSRISHRLGSSEKHFPQRDDRDNQLMNTPSNGSYVSRDPRYLYGNSSSLGVDNHTTPLHENISYFKASPDRLYPDYRSQMIPANHLEPEISIAPDSLYADYRSQLIPATHLEPESPIAPTIRFHNPNPIIDSPQDFIPLKTDVRIPEYDYHGSKNLAPSNFEMYADHLMPEHSISRMPALRNEIYGRENMFPSSFGLASGTSASPVCHLDGGLRYWKIGTSTDPLEINGNPNPQLDYYSRESEKMETSESHGYVYPTEDIKDYLNRASFRSDTQKPRRSVFSRLAKVKGNNAKSDMAVDQLMGELHYQFRSRKEVRNSGQPIAHDGDNRNFKRHIALDDDGHDCSKRKSRGSVDRANDDLGDSKRNPERFGVCDDDRDTSKRISRRSFVHDDEHDTGKGNSRRATAIVEVCDIVNKYPKHLTAPDDDHGSNKRNSGRSIARDDGHETNKIPMEAMIEDDNNLPSEQEKLGETEEEEAPLVNYKRRSAIGKGQQGSGVRACAKGFDLEIVSINPGKRRKLVRPSFGSSELTCGKSAVAGGEGNGGRQDELSQDVGWKRESISDKYLKGSTNEDTEIGLSREVIATDCFLASKLDHDVQANYGGHRECSNLTEKEVGDAFVKTSSGGETVNFCPRSMSANDGMKVKGQFGKAAKECSLTVQRPSQVAVVCARGRNGTVKDSSHEALQDRIDGSLQTESKGSRKVCSLESSGGECYKEEGLAQMLGARDHSLNMEEVTKDVVFSAVGLKELVEENSIAVVQEHGPSESECTSTMLNCSLTFNAVEDFKEEGKSQIHVANDQMPKAQWSFQDGVASTEGLEQTAEAQPELTDDSFESRGKGNEVDLATEQNTGESHKETTLSEGLIAENLLLNMQGVFQDTVVCDVSLQESTKKGLNISLQQALSAGLIAENRLLNRQWFSQDTVVCDVSLQKSTKKGLNISLQQVLSEGLIAENRLLNRQGISQDTAVCDVSLQQATKRCANVALGEFSGGSFESKDKRKKVKFCLEGTCETLDKEEQSQYVNARDSLQQLAEEPPFCTEADKVKSQKDKGLIDDSLTSDGREIFVEFKPEFSGGKTEGQVLHHNIPPSLVTAKMADEDFGCEREDKPIVSSLTRNSESEQRPLRRVKKILKRVKKGTSNPSAYKVFYASEKVDISQNTC